MSSIINRFKACEGSVELFALEGQPALELLASNPLAGFCLALNDIFHKPVIHWPLAAARVQMAHPQREILGWLGFKPATEAVAKIGRKCVPESLTLERSLQLRRVLVEDETREMLAHLRRINAGVIDLVTSRELRAAVTPQLLRAVAESDAEVARAETATLLKDTLKMRSILRCKDPLRRFVSRHRVVEEHDELVGELNLRGISRFSRRTFPPPPLPGWQWPGEQILPVCNPEALHALGREQHNCVASYQSQILSGALYIYRVVVQGEVCTLSLVKDRLGDHQIGEFKAACNREPNELSRFVVRRWLDAESTGQLHMAGSRRSRRNNRPLPAAPFVGGTWDSVQIAPVPDLETLITLVGNTTAAEFYYDRARRGREYPYQAVTPQAAHLVAIQRDRRGYRLKEIRRIDGATTNGDVLVAVSDWLGRAQGKYR